MLPLQQKVSLASRSFSGPLEMNVVKEMVQELIAEEQCDVSTTDVTNDIEPRIEPLCIQPIKKEELLSRKDEIEKGHLNDRQESIVGDHLDTDAFDSAVRIKEEEKEKDLYDSKRKDGQPDNPIWNNYNKISHTFHGIPNCLLMRESIKREPDEMEEAVTLSSANFVVDISIDKTEVDQPNSHSQAPAANGKPHNVPKVKQEFRSFISF